MPTTKTKPDQTPMIGLRLGDNQRKAVEKVCKRDGLNISEYIRFAIREQLKRDGITA